VAAATAAAIRAAAGIADAYGGAHRLANLTDRQGLRVSARERVMVLQNE
jgi:hypothetical protein